MSATAHHECLVLIEQYDPAGKIAVPSGMSFLHFALEVEGHRLEDVLAFAEQQRLRLFCQLWSGAPQQRPLVERRGNGRQCRVLPASTRGNLRCRDCSGRRNVTKWAVSVG
jgi:hypothetical protein